MHVFVVGKGDRVDRMIYYHHVIFVKIILDKYMITTKILTDMIRIQLKLSSNLFLHLFFLKGS